MLLLLLSNKIHPRVSHWPHSAVLWPLQLFSLTSGPQNLPPPPSKRLMLLPPSTWRSKILEVPPSSRFMPCSRCYQNVPAGRFWEPNKRHSEPGLWPWPPCSAQGCPCPRDTTGHKAGIDLQPSGYAGYLNATRNYVSPILCTEASLPPLRSQEKKDVWESQLEAQIYPNHYKDLHSSSHLF